MSCTIIGEIMFENKDRLVLLREEGSYLLEDGELHNVEHFTITYLEKFDEGYESLNTEYFPVKLSSTYYSVKKAFYYRLKNNPDKATGYGWLIQEIFDSYSAKKD